MTVALALVLATVLGGGDQYLGSLSRYPALTDISLLSAPWLLMPFLAGCTQREPKRAALLGLGCTYAALLGYGVMTLSPVEGAHLNLATVTAFVRSESPVFVAGVMTGPVFGWFGQRWRVRRAWLGALVTAAALCLEPVARSHADNAIRSSTVLLAEVALGLAMIAYVALRVVSPRVRGLHWR
jgi:hypothetical protein